MSSLQRFLPLNSLTLTFHDIYDIDVQVLCDPPSADTVAFRIEEVVYKLKENSFLTSQKRLFTHGVIKNSGNTPVIFPYFYGRMYSCSCE
jgi:hypothetical protein